LQERQADTPARPFSARVAYIVAGIGVVWTLLLALDLLGPLTEATFVFLGLSAAVATVLGIWRNRPAVRWPWILIATAVIVFLIGGAAREVLGTLGVLSNKRSLVPDLITIPGYLILGAGILGIVRARRLGRDVEIDALLDATVAALAAMTVAWIYLVTPALFHEHAPLDVRFVLSCYPPLSIFLVAITASFAFSAARRAAAQYFLLFGMICILIGDTIYMLVDTRLVSMPRHLIDMPYALAYVACIATLLHPSMRELTEPVPSDARAPRRGRLAVVAVALCVPALVTIFQVNADIEDRIALGVIVVALTMAAAIRVLRALRAHARSEARLAHQVAHDALTGLPNRSYAIEEADRALRLARRDRKLVALLFLDVDRFKLVNDSHGHSVGDDLLLGVAQRLREMTRPGDLVARIGGDEFVVLMTGVQSQEAAVEIAERMRVSFTAPFDVRGMEIGPSVSIGVSVTDGTDGAGAEALIRDADIAMYQAKDAGRDSVAVFDSSMRDQVTRRLTLERDLRHALDRDQLHLQYQPVVALDSGRVEGFEALLRWAHPVWGHIAPLSFIPVAEETGLILPIGSWVLQEASRQLATWRTQLDAGRDLWVAVNLSARQLRDPAIVARVRGAIDEHGIPPGALHLELTESVIMDNRPEAAGVLGQLRAMGVRIAIDDFGTGYSSLAYLQRFPVDRVKIDQSFVAGLREPDSSDETLVAAIIAMARALRVSTVAEGVESELQAQKLTELGCDSAQGYLYAKPVMPDGVPDVLGRLGVVPRLRAVRRGQVG
jgi:diguanylate cyclase (GGDEF)-like protein